MDIERIGDYTKNIVELAAIHPGRFDGGELAEEIESMVATVRGMFVDLIPALEKTDLEKARRVIAEHQEMVHRVEGHIESLAAGRVMTGNSGEAVTAALFLRYLKRIGAHLKNVATSIVNPYYRIGYREKKPPEGEDREG
jgi:phosphate uptake regulator